MQDKCESKSYQSTEAMKHFLTHIHVDVDGYIIHVG